MVDLDSSYAYSRIISAGSPETGKPFVFPNPFSQVLRISGVRKGDVVNLYDSAGRLLRALAVDSDDHWLMDMSAYVPGAYIVAVPAGAEGFSKKIKIIKN